MRRLLVACGAFVLLASGCGDLLEPAAAVVAGQKITVDEISADLNRFAASAEFKRLSEQGDAQELKRQVEQQLLTQAIRRAVLEPKAAEFGITVSEEELTQRLDEVKADFETEAAFEEALKEQGLTFDQLEELVRDSLLEEELRAKVTENAGPTEEDLQAFYEENEARFQETAAQHILVEGKALAQRLSRQLQAAPPRQVETLFAKLAKEHSTDQSNAGRGGDLGFFSPGEFVPPFEAAAADLEIGEVSDPVKTEFGFHVIRVTDRRLAPFEDVVGQIEQELGTGAADEAWEEYVAQAYEEADVKVNPRYGEFDEETFQVVDPSAEDVPGAEVPDETPAPAEDQAPAPSPAE
ncbi:MAG: peptidylprolyl isomerase [Actinomycetota bacterium]|nr:peptidylprolyl isomerase [Actinomycetota bacterium]